MYLLVPLEGGKRPQGHLAVQKAQQSRHTPRQHQGDRPHIHYNMARWAAPPHCTPEWLQLKRIQKSLARTIILRIHVC